MLYVYNFLLILSVNILRIFAFFNSKLKLGINGRKNWESYLKSIPKNKKVYWFHCASLGEFDQGLPLMNILKEKNADALIVVTFFSPSGFMHYNKRIHPVDYAMYLPFDTKRNAAKFLAILNPVVGIFVKYEFWPNLLNEAEKKQIPIVSISTLLRSNQIYFKWYGGLFRKALKNVRFFFVQNQATSKLLSELGLHNFEIIGDTRFDRVIENKVIFEAKKLDKLSSEQQKFETFLNGEKAIIFGSSWMPEEEILVSFLAANHNDKIIVAPHNVSESNIVSICSRIGSKAIRFTSFDANFKDQQVLILDTIGQLATAYSHGKVAFVGGGFSGSLHNILEPAVFGLPVFFGPSHRKFPEAEAFLKNGIGFEVKNYSDFENNLIEVSKNLDRLSREIIQYVESQKGAASKIVNSNVFKALIQE
jgi:3-deoxy-D-manno-octulosonic-acid transferase